MGPRAEHGGHDPGWQIKGHGWGHSLLLLLPQGSPQEWGVKYGFVGGFLTFRQKHSYWGSSLIHVWQPGHRQPPESASVPFFDHL